jgi:probable addiction module antidote protein
MANKTYAQWRQEKLVDPDHAARYLNAAYKDSKEAFQHAVLNVIQAHKVARIAKRVGVARESFYRSFGPEGNPAFYTFDAVMKLLNIGIEFKSAPGTKSRTIQKSESKASSSGTHRSPIAQTHVMPTFDRISSSQQAAKTATSRGTAWIRSNDTNGLIHLQLEQQYAHGFVIDPDLLNVMSPKRNYAIGQQDTAAISEKFNRVQQV